MPSYLFPGPKGRKGKTVRWVAVKRGRCNPMNGYQKRKRPRRI